MTENSLLGRVAFWVVAALAAIWACVVIGVAAFGVWTQASLIWPVIIAAIPPGLVIAAVVADRLRSREDRYYSENIYD